MKYLFWGSFFVALGLFGKIYIQNCLYGKASRTELEISASQILKKSNVVLYESSTPFVIHYTDLGIPYFTEIKAEVKGVTTLMYGVTIDSFSTSMDKVYYTPYVSPPYVDFTLGETESSLFDSFSAEDFSAIKAAGINKAPTPDMQPVCEEFEALVTTLSKGAIYPVKNN
jgi:hypothetical protein